MDIDELETLLLLEQDVKDEKSFFEVADLNQIINEISKKLETTPANSASKNIEQQLLDSLEDAIKFNESLVSDIVVLNDQLNFSTITTTSTTKKGLCFVYHENQS